MDRDHSAQAQRQVDAFREHNARLPAASDARVPVPLAAEMRGGASMPPGWAEKREVARSERVLEQHERRAVGVLLELQRQLVRLNLLAGRLFGEPNHAAAPDNAERPSHIDGSLVSLGMVIDSQEAAAKDLGAVVGKLDTI